MRFVIGTVDGAVHESKEFTREDMQADLDAVDGLIGTGVYSNKRFRTVDEALEFMSDLLKYDRKNDTHTFGMEMPNGSRRKFNVRHVVWWEFYEEDI